MKKIFAIACAMLLTAGAAIAQDSYQRLQVSYVAYKMTNSEIGDKEITPKGVNIAGVMGFPISDVQPLFLETGLGVTWAHSAVDYSLAGVASSEFKFTYMNAAIPINGVYKFEINDKVSLNTYAGLNFKVNFMAKQHNNYTEQLTGSKVKESYSWLSKKDMGTRDNRASIFQLGWQAGCGFNFGALYLGYQFQTDIMKFQQYENGDAHRWITNYITLGYTL